MEFFQVTGHGKAQPLQNTSTPGGIVQGNAKQEGPRINLAVFNNSQNKLARQKFAENAKPSAKLHSEVDILLWFSARN